MPHYRCPCPHCHSPYQSSFPTPRERAISILQYKPSILEPLYIFIVANTLNRSWIKIPRHKRLAAKLLSVFLKVPEYSPANYIPSAQSSEAARTYSKIK